MLDEINYTKTDTGQILKEVCHYSYVSDPAAELAAIKAQLEDFISGQDESPKIEIADVINNYQMQVKFLESLLP